MISKRRSFLKLVPAGFTGLALKGLLASETSREVTPAASSRIKSVVFCFMDGGPSHVDTFDPKPALTKHQGKPIGKEAVSKRAQAAPGRVWMGSPWKFQQHGKNGLWVSDLLPHMATCADDLCVVRSLVGELPLHGQQNLLLHTGRVTGQAPSFGSWVSYGLATGNANLPGYVLLNNDWVPNGGYENFGSAFLPAVHAATTFRAKGVPVDDIVPADKTNIQRAKLDFLKQVDRSFGRNSSEPSVIESAVKNYETAFQMQSAVPKIADVSNESPATRKLYGLDRATDHQKFYALQCLRARKLVEAGVRFIEITCPLTHANNSPWDQHGELKKHHGENAMITDQPVAALITDLKQRGLLDQTLVVWAGEMGRTPHTPKVTESAGRDHHVNGYTIVLAGGGFKGGSAYGSTDEFGNSVVDKAINIHDIHATILHQLGINHERLTFRYAGRDHRLTDVHGTIVRDLLL